MNQHDFALQQTVIAMGAKRGTMLLHAGKHFEFDGIHGDSKVYI